VSIYIAGPMTGYPEFNYPAFNDAGRALRDAGFDTLNPVDSEDENPTPGIPQPWEWYMRRALLMVLAADCVAMLPGWEKSRGASLEVHVARALGLDCRPLDVWLYPPDVRTLDTTELAETLRAIEDGRS